MIGNLNSDCILKHVDYLFDTGRHPAVNSASRISYLAFRRMHVYEYVPLWLTVNIIVIANNFVHALDGKQQILQEITEENNIKHDEPILRMTRSNRAISALIKSAVEIQTQSKQYRKFVKKGSVTNAIDDFMKLKPTHIRKRLYSTEAYSGDVLITLRRKDTSQIRQPSITIDQPGDVAPIKIVYEKGGIRP